MKHGWRANLIAAQVLFVVPLLAACGGSDTTSNGGSATTPEPTASSNPDSPSATGASPNGAVVCATFGGCDVQDDMADGTQKQIALQTSSFADARARQNQECQGGGVVDAVVLGHNAPHVILDQPCRGTG